MRQRNVYILSKGGHDYSDAERFGKLVFLGIPSHLRWDMTKLRTELESKLEDAEEDDLFIISHLTSHCCVATAILTEWFGKVNFLVYRKDKYHEANLVTMEEKDERAEG